MSGCQLEWLKCRHRSPSALPAARSTFSQAWQTGLGQVLSRAGFVRALEQVTQPTCAAVSWDDEHRTAVFKSHTFFCACEVPLFS